MLFRLNLLCPFNRQTHNRQKRHEYYAGKPERIAQLEDARAEDELARKIHELREQAGLTQEKLARIVGTTASVISRLEHSDYEGHSLTMLKRIAAAVDKRVEIRFVSQRRKFHPA